MFCSKCNNQIQEGQEVCLSCGHILRYESEESKLCIHCNRNIPIAYKKCPYCKKKQRSKKKMIFIIILLVITFLVNYGALDRINHDYELSRNKNYKKDCITISYEDMIRKNKFYDEAYIKVEGKIISVEKVSMLFNEIKIEIITEENPNYKLDIYYKNYDSKGFLIDDEIIVYGKYKSLNGNTPQIKSRIIETKKSN